MKPNFIATDKQARDIAEHEHVTFIELLDKQPPEGYEFHAVLPEVDEDDKPLGEILAIFLSGVSACHIPLRYPAGKHLVKESWFRGHDYNGNRIYVYKADNLAYPYCIKWRSPASMPIKAVRSELDLTVLVKRVQELTKWNNKHHSLMIDILHPEWHNLRKTIQPDDIKQNFIQWFNDLHARPRKTKDGKGYECFPYSDEYAKILEQDKRCELLADWYYWKGLPLAVNYNPFAVIMDGKVKKI